VRTRLWIFPLLAAAGCLGPVARRGAAPAPAPRPAAVGGLIRLDGAAGPALTDDAARPDLVRALRASVDFYVRQPADRKFFFGSDSHTAADLADAYGRLADALADGGVDLPERVRRDFVVYMSAGTDADRTVVFSSYYEHELAASLKRTDRYRYPLYARPADLEERVAANGVKSVVRRTAGAGRPYYTREEIDSKGVLRGRGLEIAWADDPVHVFFLQVQGSGWLRLPDGKRLRVRYAGNNGHPYKSVGGHLIATGVLPGEKFSRRTMVAFLEKSPRRQHYLNVNPRYVFFQIDRGVNREKVFGSINAPLTGGRSVATDFSLFPAGALGWMETTEDIPVARYILNQDEGGAIKGPGRVDFFAGGGPDAEKFAVSFWEKGRLYFLAPRRGSPPVGAGGN
jgi:membrane-bound lytic murein transglycosylase A